jgi:hypothetical protein
MYDTMISSKTAGGASDTITKTETTTATTKRRVSKADMASARARAVATINVKADVGARKVAASAAKDTDNNNDFAVEAAKKKAAEAARRKAAGEEVTNSNGNEVHPGSAKGEDFAVAAARRASRNGSRTTTKAPLNEDFAVAAARKIAATAASPATITNRKANGPILREGNATSTNAKGASVSVPETASTVQRIDDGFDDNNSKLVSRSPPELPDHFKVDDYMGDNRAFRMVISKPDDDRSKALKTNKRSASSVTINGAMSESKQKETADIEAKGQTKQSVGQRRKLNLRVVKEEKELNTLLDPLADSNIGRSDNEETDKGPSGRSPEEQKQIDIFKDAQNVMDEIASQGREMTAEDLLKDILKFDEEKTRGDMPGMGFVSGALEKAKELMRDRHDARRAKSHMEIGFKEVENARSVHQKVLDPFESQDAPRTTELSPEDELKAMFAAGQRIADGKITQSMSPGRLANKSQKRTSEQEVEDLISQERSVSKYARVLDDELAELEVCINSSPGEEFDGPRRNPLFDLMSGPEVYNPNVDLDSVNYPGALPGTKDVKLPKELAEAIKQAEFATSVLMSMKTIEKNDANGEPEVRYFHGTRELSVEQVNNLQDVVAEASRIGIIDNPVDVIAERSRLQLILDELWNQPEERFYEIASNYKHLLLSDRFVMLVRERLNAMVERDLDALRRNDESLKEAHEREREILGWLVVFAQALVKEARALGAELEAQQLEIVRSICNVAMDPKHTTEEETAVALSDAVRGMRLLLDDVFVAYLKYAVAEEEAKLARAGFLDDPDHNQWLFVLKIVQQGVYAEIAKGINRYIEHIWYVLRMDTRRQRRLLLEMLIDDMPTLDVRPFVQVVDNIVGSLGDGVKGDFDGVVPLGEMTNKLLQLHRDVQELLPPDRIALKSRDADEWAARQKQRLLEQRRIGEQRRQAYLDGEVEASGEIERIP